MALSILQQNYRSSQQLHFLLLQHRAPTCTEPGARGSVAAAVSPLTPTAPRCSLPRAPPVCLSVHLAVSLSGASPLCSPWTCRVGGGLQLVSCSTPLPLLRFLPSSSCCSSRCSAFAASSLLLVSLPLLVAGAA